MKLNKLSKLIKFKDILDTYDSKFNEIVKHELSEEFIDEFFYQLKPFQLEIYQKLTPYLIEKYNEALNWHSLSSCQELPEYIIEKYFNKVNWRYISWYQSLSEKFIYKWQNYIVYDNLMDNNNISDTVKRNVKKYFLERKNNECK